MTGPKRGPSLSCLECPVGRASGVGTGGFCPFVDRERKAGELIYVEGEPAQHAWFIKRGTVVLSRERGEDEGEGGVRAVRFTGSFVGLEVLISDSYHDSARAVTDVTLCGATREGMDQWVGPDGSPARTALELTLRASQADRRRSAQRDGTAVQRVAEWLRDEGPRGMALTLPRQVIADVLGMRPETLSRAIADLRKQGAIDATRTSLEIVDEELLEVAARGH